MRKTVDSKRGFYYNRFRMRVYVYTSFPKESFYEQYLCYSA